MFKRTIIASLIIGSAAITYTLKTDKISCDNKILHDLIRNLHRKNPDYALKLFQKLVQYNILKNLPNSQKVFIGNGFDIEARLLNGLVSLGVGGVQIGPISYLPSSEQVNKNKHLGINYARSKINQFNEDYPQHKLQISLNLSPDYQVAKYTPYIIKQNLLNALQVALQDAHLINYITINFKDPNIHQFLEQIIKSHTHMINDLMKEGKQLIIAKCEKNKCKPPLLVLQVTEQLVPLFFQNKSIDKFKINSNMNLDPQRCLKMGVDIWSWEDILKKLQE